MQLALCAIGSRPVVANQQPDGLKIEAIGQSFSFCHDAVVLPMSE
jgi:hypothetical protein